MSHEAAPFAVVADDDPLIRLDAGDILWSAGFRVIEADGVSSALAEIEERAASVQLLFTDVQMPPEKLTGYDLAREVSERWPHIGILVASGEAPPAPGDMPENAIFINKPFSAEVVYDRLKLLLPDGQKPAPLASN